MTFDFYKTLKSFSKAFTIFFEESQRARFVMYNFSHSPRGQNLLPMFVYFLPPIAHTKFYAMYNNAHVVYVTSMSLRSRNITPAFFQHTRNLLILSAIWYTVGIF